MMEARMARMFHLKRNTDQSGKSGTGVVAEGCEFTDGVVVIRWLTKYKTTTVFDGGMPDLEDLHHVTEGDTEVIWRD